MPARLDIAMQRNEDFGCTLEIKDNVGSAIDITGWTLSLKIRERLETVAVLQAASIEIIDAATGLIGIKIEGPGAALGTYGNPLLAYELPYDLLAVDPEGTSTVFFAGYIVLSRGIS